ncbi:hypothetical protein FRC01_011106, partial [Tulasnella sp. 417]
MTESRSKSPTSPTRSRHSVRHRKILRDLREVVDLLLDKGRELDSSDVEDDDEAVETVHADNSLREESHQQFKAFYRQFTDLDHRLTEFMQAIRQLGSSSGLIHSVRGLQRLMAEILEVFRSNAAFIYNEFRGKESPELPNILRDHGHHHTKSRENRGFPELLKALSGELKKFLNHLRDIPEFSDNRLSESIVGFEGWLVYRARGLDDFQASLHSTAVKRYINSLMLEMGEYLTRVGDALTKFAKDGVPVIRDAQNRSQERLMNMSTVVCALLHYSSILSNIVAYLDRQHFSLLLPLQPFNILQVKRRQIVRALWVSSLILSIASAINSQLAMHCMESSYVPIPAQRSSDVDIALPKPNSTYFPHLFGPDVHNWTVVIWEGGERWQASRSGLESPHVDPGVPSLHLPWEPYEDLKSLSTKIKTGLVFFVRNAYLKLGRSFRRLFTAFPLGSTHPSDGLDQPELQGMDLPSPVHLQSGRERTSFEMSLNVSRTSLSSQNTEARPPPERRFSSVSKRISLQVPPAQSPLSTLPARASSYEGSDEPEPHLKWKRVAWQIGLRSLPTSGPHKLKSLRNSGDILPQIGGGPVRDLRFAPNGKWLAASFADGSAGLWEVKDGFHWHRSVPAPSGYLAWSPDSSCLLTRHDNGVQLWAPGTNPQIFKTKNKYIAFTWLSDGKNFVAATEQSIFITEESDPFIAPILTPSKCATLHRFQPRGGKLGAIAVIKDKSLDEELRERLLSLFGSRVQRVAPKDVQPQKRIAVYDIDQQKVIFQVPVCGEALHVTVSRNGEFALISYAASPPELWHIEISRHGKVSLELYHMYLPELREGNRPNF